MEKKKWIREACTDKFEGWPCDYPNCRCAPENRAGMEQEYAIEQQQKRIADHIDGYDRDDLGESPDY